MPLIKGKQMDSSAAGIGLKKDSSGDFQIGTDSGNGNPTFTDAVWTFPVDTTAEGLFITGTPTDSTHAVNKDYVDNVAAGLSWKDAALTSDADLSAATIAYSDPVLTITVLGTGSSLGLLDTVEPVATDRVLILDAANAGTGANAALNGLWAITGGGVNSLTMERTTDMDASGEFDGSAVFVQSGATNADTAWVQTAAITTVDTDAVVFSQFSGGAVLTEGAGIDITSNTVKLDIGTLSGVTVDVATDSIAFLDSDDASTKLESIVDLVSGIAGDNLTATSGVLEFSAVFTLS